MDKKILEAAAKELTKLLYNDIKNWIVSSYDSAKGIYKRMRVKNYDSLGALIRDIKINNVKNGQLVSAKCKPSLFGPYINFFRLQPIVGNHTDMRLGPPITSTNPIFGMMAQVTSHLAPVGMYPSIDKHVVQGFIYPHAVSAMGFLGLMPGINNLVEYLPVLISSKYLQSFHYSCQIKGTIRMLDLDSVAQAGFKPEDYEELRQKSQVWFLDVTDEFSNCVPITHKTDELWGGLYASGHLEIMSGEIQLQDLINAFVAVLSEEKFNVQFDQNRAGEKEILIFGRGIRMCVGSKYPVYSLHMDANFGNEYPEYKKRFDSVSINLLRSISELCKKNSVGLHNEFDYDFNYNNSSKSFTILRSLSADFIKDPLAISIRDWHRKRSLPTGEKEFIKVPRSPHAPCIDWQVLGR